jgi:hypothetical protein
MTRIKTITDGVDTVDILNTGETGIIATRGGFGSRSFGPHQYDDALGVEDFAFVERWELVYKGSSHDNLATQSRTLIKILRNAWRYHRAPKANNPVYITERTKDETNTRYALVYQSPEVSNPDLFDIDFELNNLIETQGVSIARFMWRNVVPGTLGNLLVLDPTDGPDYTPEEVDYEIDLLDHLGRAPTTQTGGILGRPGKFGRGVQLAEATTNLITNPSFETNVGGWTAAGTNTIAISSDQAKFGTRSMKVTYGDTLSFVYFSPLNIAAGAHQISGWFYIPSSWDGGAIQMHEGGSYDGATGSQLAVVDMDIRDEWQFVTFDMVVDAGDVEGYIMIDGSAPTVGRFFYVDAFQAEAKAYPTPYCDGSLGLGHAWTDGAHASTSTRVAAELNYDDDVTTLIQSTGSFFGWWHLAPSTSIAKWHNLMDARGADNNNRILFYQDNDTGKLALYLNGGNRITTVGAGSMVLGDLIFFCLTWDFDNDDYNIFMYENDGTKYTGNATTSLSFPTLTELGIGNSYAGSDQINGVLDDVVILGRVLTEAEFDTLYNSGKAFAGDPDLLLYLNFDGPKRVHVSNFRDQVNLTHVKVVNADGGPGYTDVHGTTEWTMFPDPIGTNDELLFGSTDQFPKMIVIPRLSVAGDFTDSTFILNYRNGGWTALVLGTDYTCFPGPTLEDCFEQTDHDIVISINPPNNATKVVIDGDNCHWVQLIESHADPDYATHPVSGYEPYVQGTPEIRIPSTLMKGDVPPYICARISTPAGGDENEGFSSLSKIILGAKSNPGIFASHLNAGGQDTPANWIVSAGTDATSTARNRAPGGFMMEVDFAGDETLVSRVRMKGPSKLSAWIGSYRAYVRVEQKGGSAGDLKLMLRTYIHETNVYSPKYDLPVGGIATAGADQEMEVIDLGNLHIPFGIIADADEWDTADIIFEIHATRTTGNATLEIYDLILIPTDEWTVGLEDPLSDSVNGSSALRGGNVLDMDGGVIRNRTVKYIVEGTKKYLASNWLREGKPMTVEPETEVYIYSLALHFPSGGIWGTAPFIGSSPCHYVVELYAHFLYYELQGGG